MHCPFCKHPDTKVVDSRLQAGGEQVRRRRECLSCKERFTTFETADLHLPRIVKRDGSREIFNENKLANGLTRALEKRPVSSAEIDVALQNIARRAMAYKQGDVPSRVLGDWVMAELRELDQVAYVRFASVYREFQDVSEFRDEIDRLESGPSAEQRKRQADIFEQEE